MHLMYFTEQPMSAYPTEEGDRYGYTALLFPNKFFDPVAGQPALQPAAGRIPSWSRSRL